MSNNTLPQSPTEISWRDILRPEFDKPYFKELMQFVEKERSSNIPIYPPHEDVFNAFKKTPFSKVKAVIVGQDPYHGPGQAHGLSFSVQKGIRPPPSLQNIFKELHADLGVPIPNHGCLESWADQGIMLLNASLTVRQSAPMSHAGKGWETFTDAAIAQLCQRQEPVIFVLWGKFAQDKCRNILTAIHSTRHLVLTAAHPSPFSAHSGFFGCKHFSKINDFLVSNGSEPIKWESL